MDDLGPIQLKRLIRSYLDTGRLMEAIVLAKKAIERFEPAHDYRVLLAEVYWAQGNKLQALKQLEEVTSASPDHLDAKSLLARIGDA